MSAEAMWVCHTCKTVCSPGHRYLGKRAIQEQESVSDIRDITRALRDDIQAANDFVEISNCDRVMGFLDDLHRWVSRHEGHVVHIGSDYTTDVIDLDSYHNETVNGKISSVTRLELQTTSADEWRAANVKEIGKIIGEHGVEIRQGDTDTVAAILHDKFSMKEL